MAAKILDGKAHAALLHQELKQEIATLKDRPPCLAVVLVGDNPASTIYVRKKIEASADVGIRSMMRSFPSHVSSSEIEAEIDRLNADPEVDAILVQLPLPEQINPNQIMVRIAPHKDVDGLNPINLGKLFIGLEDGIIPCTPLGIMTMVEREGINLSGKHAVIIGRSMIVGKPMAALLLQANATVTQLHSRSKNISEICLQADLIVTALGKPHFLTKGMVKPGAVVIDVGINKIDDPTAPKGYRIVGDADFESLLPICSAITPVPGGVGPLTIATLLSNTLKCRRLQKRSS
jgi:methylenetetrahydrofolate dehydrogenase (NADP+)/methenyltetrahydrofolate cyclohydrolase